jgi:thiamine biosynthesis lipoprotein
LNGIAQGFITDRIADLLRAEGMDHVLIDLGEMRSIGTHPAGRPWHVGVADPADPVRIAERIDIANMAVATSGGYGTRFDASGRYNHLIDPRTGGCSPAAGSVTVIARDATTADAASTALSLMATGEIGPALARLGAVEARLHGPEGVMIIEG